MEGHLQIRRLVKFLHFWHDHWKAAAAPLCNFHVTATIVFKLALVVLLVTLKFKKVKNGQVPINLLVTLQPGQVAIW